MTLQVVMLLQQCLSLPTIPEPGPSFAVRGTREGGYRRAGHGIARGLDPLLLGLKLRRTMER